MAMETYRLTRRVFLVLVSTILGAVLAPFRRWLAPRNELIGDWTVVQYVCDGKAAFTTAHDIRVSITPERLAVYLQIPGLPHDDESSRYTIHPVKHEIDIRNQDDTATFEGVYTLNDECLTLAWDTAGEGRPQSVLEANRFGLNRITLRKA